MKKRKKKGQGLLEYVVVLTAIVVAIIFVATGTLKTGAQSVYDETGVVMDTALTKWKTANP